MRKLVPTLVALSALVACFPGGNPEQGFSDCGGVTCAPGQYCADPITSFCENGCTSDHNCEDGTHCEITDDFFNEGECVPDQERTEDPTPADPLAACQAACDHFQDCGLGAAEAAQCRSDCSGLSADQQTAVGNCDDSLSCDATLSCLGVQCFSDGDCGSGGWCVDYTCM